MPKKHAKHGLHSVAIATWLAIGGAAWGCTPPEEGVDSGVSKACGTRGAPACAAGEFCKFSDSAACGAADAPGVCSETPELCTKIYAPVCACDGKTYANECEAHAAGTSVRTRAACDEPDAATEGNGGPPEVDAGNPTFCGGFAGIRCTDPGTYCDFPASTNCGSGDQGGSCQPITEICPQIYKPVCGCDGKTYSNRCTAAGASVSVRYEGPC